LKKKIPGISYNSKKKNSNSFINSASEYPERMSLIRISVCSFDYLAINKGVPILVGFPTGSSTHPWMCWEFKNVLQYVFKFPVVIRWYYIYLWLPHSGL
jgi:hypothetical protein